ncbi:MULTISPECIES: hypothetical protein [unclassified Mesorhizobium]|nr:MULTISPECIES: hypothetical protein [unclassified Mesorhizobium]
MNDAAREVADVVGRVQGNIRRKRLRKQAALSPLRRSMIRSWRPRR